jgi:enoyl-CoA hydratase
VTQQPEVVVERRGCAGFLILNRPQALNALTLAMVRDISAALDVFERDSKIDRVVLCGAGDRAFCAGGDIRWLYERGRARDFDAQSQFFREEYHLNARIHRYAKPYVSLIDGIVMGGGVGVSLHGKHRVATEKATFAMPEVGIGFFPDVGATYALPSPLAAQAALLERAFSQPDIPGVEAALRAEGCEFARQLLDMMASKSPTSLKIALRQMQLGASLSFEQAMQVEFRIVTRICHARDFYEGVRAAIVDKDNRPQWDPAPADVDAYFAPLGANDLNIIGEAA